jgi:hypothetical protein
LTDNYHFAQKYKPILLILGVFTLFALLGGMAFILAEVVGGTLKEFLDRMGILLQLIGTLSVIPEVIGDKKINKLEKKFPAISMQFKEVLRQIKYLQDGGWAEFSYLEGLPSVLLFIVIYSGVIISSLFAISLIALREPPFGQENQWFYFTIGISSLFWLITLPFFIVNREMKPTKMHQLKNFIFQIFLVIFYITSIPVTIMSFPLISAFCIFIRFVLITSQFLLKFSFKRVIAFITLPFLIIGTTLQLISSMI